MWELIEANKRRSIFLFICMGIILIILGGAIGAYIAVQEDIAADMSSGIIGGSSIAIVIWIIWSTIAYISGDKIVLKSCGAMNVSKDIHPQLFNVVEEMKIAASLPMPKIYIIPSQTLNAFATGKTPENSAIAVTAGLLSKLNRDELQGVIAHEMSHILNRDILFMTFSGVMLGAITLISQIFLRGSLHTTRRYRSSKNSNSGGALFIITIIIAILGPLLAQLFYFAISRKREYLADATAARLTRFPAGLASALKKISLGAIDNSISNKILDPMYISAPNKSLSAVSFNSTHPPIQDRIRILEKMSSGASYKDYQNAYRSICKKGAPIIPVSGLNKNEKIDIREGILDPIKNSSLNTRNAGDIIRAVNNFMFLTCTCGLKIKVPPDFKKSSINCPKCAKILPVPIEGLAIATAVSAAKNIKNNTKTNQKQVYTCKGKGWESLLCDKCGKLIQLSPMFSFSEIKCKKCGNEIEIKRLSH